MRNGLAFLLAIVAAASAVAQSPSMIDLSQDGRSVESKWQDDAIRAIYGVPPVARSSQPAPVVFREVQSASSPVEISAQNAVRISFSTGRGGGQAGSGVYLGERLVATAYHVPQGTPGRGVVEFRDGIRANCNVLQTDKVWDQCIVELDREHPTLQGVEIAGYNPRRGEMVYSCGFGAGFRIFGGRMTGDWFMPGNRPASTRDWFHHTNGAVSGDSGGPVFNSKGQLIGCLWGSTGSETVATGTGRFHTFCKPLLPRLAQWRANLQGRPILAPGIAIVSPKQGYGTQCYPGGNCPPSSPPSYGGGGQTPVPPPATPTPQPDPTPNVEIDYDKLVELLVPVLIKDDRLRGPQGERGPAGPQGPRGVDGVAGDPRDLRDEIDSALADLDLSQRVLIVDGKSSKVLDDETYRRGEPIVLDVNQLIRERSR